MSMPGENAQMTRLLKAVSDGEVYATPLRAMDPSERGTVRRAKAAVLFAEHDGDLYVWAAALGLDEGRLHRHPWGTPYVTINSRERRKALLYGAKILPQQRATEKLLALERGRHEPDRRGEALPAQV